MNELILSKVKKNTTKSTKPINSINKEEEIDVCAEEISKNLSFNFTTKMKKKRRKGKKKKRRDGRVSSEGDFNRVKNNNI